MLKNIEKLGKSLSKTEQQAINGGIHCCLLINNPCCVVKKPWDD